MKKLWIFSGKYCQAIGKDWHPECFKCQAPGCQTSLKTTGFIEDKGQVFCRACFERDIAYTCAKCGKKIIGVILKKNFKEKYKGNFEKKIIENYKGNFEKKFYRKL